MLTLSAREPETMVAAVQAKAYWKNQKPYPRAASSSPSFDAKKY
jgi:hypothetical protein